MLEFFLWTFVVLLACFLACLGFLIAVSLIGGVFAVFLSLLMVIEKILSAICIISNWIFRVIQRGVRTFMGV